MVVLATQSRSGFAPATASAGVRRESAPPVAFLSRGRHHLLKSEQQVATSPADAFAFFSQAGNLNALTPAFLHFNILTPLPIAMGEGTLIEYRLRLMGLPVRWLTRIAEWRPDRGFIDVQLRGPYERWIHHHHFTPCDGGTLVRDVVEYALPHVPLSSSIHAWFVRPTLGRIFAYRREAIARAIG